MGRPNLYGETAKDFKRAWDIVERLSSGEYFTSGEHLGIQYGLRKRGGLHIKQQVERILPTVSVTRDYGIFMPAEFRGKKTAVEPESCFERAIDIVVRLKVGETFTSKKIMELYGVCRMRAQQLMKEIFFELPVQREINPGEHKMRYIIRWRRTS